MTTLPLHQANPEANTPIRFGTTPTARLTQIKATADAPTHCYVQLDLLGQRHHLAVEVARELVEAVTVALAEVAE